MFWFIDRILEDDGVLALVIVALVVGFIALLVT